MITHNAAAAFAVCSLLIASSLAHAQSITAPDSDGDGINDARDNCLLTANVDQRDTNNDGYGNACDMDLNNDNVVNVVDLGLLRTVFFTTDPDADANGDGVVNVVDLGILRAQFFQPPGPTRFLRLADEFDAWGDAASWLPARVPTADDHVLLDTGGQTIRVDGPVTVRSLQVQNGSIDSSGSTFNIVTTLLVEVGDLFIVRDLILNVGESIDVREIFQLEFGGLALTGEEGTFRISASGNVDISNALFNVPQGVTTDGALDIWFSDGTLGPLDGSGDVFFLISDLRLVGVHDGRFLEPNGGTLTLAGEIVSTFGMGPQITVRNNEWVFEPGVRIEGVVVEFEDYILEAPADLTLQDIEVQGELTLAADASLSLVGLVDAFAFDLTLAAPATVVQALPELRFNGPNFLLTGFGSIVLPPAPVAGVAHTTIIMDDPGGEVMVYNFDIEAHRSLRLAPSPTTSMEWRGNWLVDGGMAPPLDLTAFDIEGDWQLEGSIIARDAVMNLDGEWLVFDGKISGTRAQIAFEGDWDVASGSTALTDSTISLDIPEFGSAGDISLTNSTATIGGELSSNALNGVSSDLASTVVFVGDYVSFGGALSLDLDELPDGFAIGPGAMLLNVTVEGSEPLSLGGGVLNTLTLEVDAIIENGASVDLSGLFLDNADVILQADDATTTLTLDEFNGMPALRGMGEIQFAGTATSDDLNTLVLSSFSSGYADTLALRTITTGGRVVGGQLTQQFSFGMGLALDAPGRDVLIVLDNPFTDQFEFVADVTVGAQSTLSIVNTETILFEGNLHLGASAELHTESFSTIEFVDDFMTPRVWSVDIAGPDDFGRLTSPSSTQLVLDHAELAPILVDGYVPTNCTTFDIAESLSSDANLGGLDTTGLGGLDASFEDVFLLRLTVFDTPNCGN